jgi:hypothetical protein
MPSTACRIQPSRVGAHASIRKSAVWGTHRWPAMASAMALRAGYPSCDTEQAVVWRSHPLAPVPQRVCRACKTTALSDYAIATGNGAATILSANFIIRTPTNLNDKPRCGSLRQAYREITHLTGR